MARIMTEESTLTRRRKALSKETQTLQRLLRVEAGLAAALLLAGLAWYVWQGSGALLGLGLFLALCFGAHWLRIRQNSREDRIVQAGLRGETEVTRQLGEALDNDHYIFNDVVIKNGRQSAQIDQLIVCPKGLFAIETKNWRGHIEGREDDERWTQIKQPDTSGIKVYNPIRQTRRHVEVLTGALKRAGLPAPPIQSMVVFLSRNTTFDVPDASIPVVRPAEAVSYIAKHEVAHACTEAEIAPLVEWLMKNQ